MSEEQIKCELCGEHTHIIKKHLEAKHGERSDTPMTYEEYRQRYPNSPVLSQSAEMSLIETINNRKKEEVSKLQQLADSKKVKLPLDKLFNLDESTGAFREDGSPILVDYLNCAKEHRMVPMIDDNYVFDVEILKTLLMGITANIPTYLYGHAGVGKSTVVEQVCARTNRPQVRVQHTINTEESHIVGQWTVKSKVDDHSGKTVSETIFELGPLPLAMKNGWVYLADEYDKGDPGVMSVYQAVLEGKPLFIKEADEENRVIRPHPNFRFVATGNTNGSGDESGLYGSTEVQDAATIERFGIVIYVGYMSKSKETKIVANQADLHEADADSIVEFCNKIRNKFPNDISLTLGPRVAINIGRIGMMKGSFAKGAELCFANRLPEGEKEVVMQVAQRVWGS